MPDRLFKLIAEEIADSGPMRVDRFMALALGHPEHGYYMTRDPFGRDGDFTTAPEISQMFGEVIGALFVHQWQCMGSPSRFHVLECGPGRGTLMADMLRIIGRLAPPMLQGARVHLLEMSPALKEKQEAALQAYDVSWHEGLETLPDDAPYLIVGNEFLDALPVRQFMRVDDGWRERVVTVDPAQSGSLVFAVGDAAYDTGLPQDNIASGSIYETAPARIDFVQKILSLLQRVSGYSLWIDYGAFAWTAGDTLQAVARHEYVDVLHNPGTSDITAHVDFAALCAAAKTVSGITVHGPVTQAAFLKKIGIEERARVLPDAQTGLHRLTHSDEMGSLFKVVGFSCGGMFDDSGF